ncbi:MAG: aminotransferase class I/II-fold pyridoxal phosphate-dependent enzyme [Pseudomonadota bacterium]
MGEFGFIRSDILKRPLNVPFVGPETLERASGKPFKARLGANESGFGPSPRAVEAMQREAYEAWKYPDPTAFDLHKDLAAHHGISLQQITIGEGIDGVIANAMQLCVAPGTPVVMSKGAYPTAHFHAVSFGAAVHAVPFLDGKEDLAGLARASRRQNARMVYLSNPNNPLGSYWTASDMKSFIEQVGDETLVLLDEAYAETAPSDAQLTLDVMPPNVLRLRTFSKAYGLAGIRIGFGIGDARVIAQFEKLRNHFALNRIGLAGARAALADQNHLAQAVANIAMARQRIVSATAEFGFTGQPSATNFVLVDCETVATAERLADRLMSLGVFVRRPAVRSLQHCVRISAGNAAAMDYLEEALTKFSQDGLVNADL